jgi:hypothetical protein
LGDAANRLLGILSCKRLLSRSLGLDACVFLTATTRNVSLPEVHRACHVPLEPTAARRNGASSAGVE